MKDVAKAAVGTVVLLYGIYGYLSGAIYEIPSRRYHAFEDILIVGDGVIFIALSYVAFAFIFYVWAVPVRAEYTQKKNRKIKKYKQSSMFVLFLVGSTLQLVGALVD